MSASSSRPHRVRLLTATAAAVLGATVLLAGPGGEGGQAIAAQPVSLVAAPAAEASRTTAAKSAIQIYKAARKKAKKAKTVRVQATIKDTDGDVKMDLRLTAAGKATGSITTPAEGSMRLILVSRKKGYFKPGPKMLNQIADGDEAVKAMLAGRWLTFRKGDGLDDVFTLTAMKTYTQDVFVLSGPTSGLVKVKGAKVKGYKKTVGLKEKGYDGTLLVAADGTSRLASFRAPDGRLTYSRWNKKVKVKAPAHPLDIRDFS